MADDVAGLLQELSGILQRISEENQAGRPIQEAFRPKPEAQSNRPEDTDLPFRERPLQALQQQSRLLESLIEQLKERSKKG